MRSFVVCALFALVLALVMDAANAQAVEYTNEDLLNSGLIGIGAILTVLGFISGKQR